MKPQSQAIVVREVPTTGVGQTPDETYNQITGVLTQILGYFDQIVQQNPQDLTAPRMANLTTELWQLVQQYNTEVVAMLQEASAKVAAAQSSSANTSTALQQAQAQDQSNVSPGAAAAIAVGSAIGGGILGYLVRAKVG